MIDVGATVLNPESHPRLQVVTGELLYSVPDPHVNAPFDGFVGVPQSLADVCVVYCDRHIEEVLIPYWCLP